jgi:hypothetical protein
VFHIVRKTSERSLRTTQDIHAFILTPFDAAENEFESFHGAPGQKGSLIGRNFNWSLKVLVAPAEREVSARLNVGGQDHFAPLLGFGGDERAEVGRR